MRNKLLLGALIFYLSFPLFSQNIENNTVCKPLIIIDAGHGGRDAGAVVKTDINNVSIFLQEKDLNLQIALQLFAMLAYYNEWEVLMTRIDDETLTLDERSALIKNDGRQTLFISLHQSYSRITETGFTIYYRWNSKLAENIAQGLTTTIGDQIPLKEIKHGYWQIGEQKSVVAIIVECGFLSNKYEAALLANQVFQRKISAGIALGIKEYFEK
jgi:N-acetylmuramoyl-L-alanine amidase